MKTKMVKTSNELNNFRLGSLTPIEADVFNAICVRVKDQGCRTIRLSIDEIKEMIDYTPRQSFEKFDKILMGAYVKFFNMPYFKVEQTKSGRTKGEVVHIFRRFAWDMDEGWLELEIEEDQAYLFNNLISEFTIYPLSEFIEIHGKYAKCLYRLLKQWQAVGKMTITLEELRAKLDIPSSYKTVGEINRSIIDKSMEELKPYFKSLKYKPITERGAKGGRNKITGYTFTFDSGSRKTKGKRKGSMEQLPSLEEPLPGQMMLDLTAVNRIAAHNHYEATQWYCPRCHRPLYKKWMDGKGGNDPGYWIYGHPDFRTGGCDWSTTDTRQCIELHDVELEEEIRNQTPEQKAQAQQLADLMAGFGKGKK